MSDIRIFFHIEYQTVCDKLCYATDLCSTCGCLINTNNIQNMHKNIIVHLT